MRRKEESGIRETDPVIGIGSDDVHVTTYERQDFAGVGSGIFDDEVSSAGEVGDVVEEERSAAGGGAEGEEGIEYVIDYAILLGDQLRWVVLDEL